MERLFTKKRNVIKLPETNIKVIESQWLFQLCTDFASVCSSDRLSSESGISD